jgi:outer membrane protein with beta-barrel domain
MTHDLMGRPGMFTRILVLLAIALLPAQAAAQDHVWAAELSAGITALVDEASVNYWTVAGSLRRYVTPRIAIGPEMAAMNKGDAHRDRLIMVTGNVTVDLYTQASRRVAPFLVGGIGVFAGREKFASGLFWSSDPAFTVGGGVRAAVGDRASIAGEYRLGWELHHRVTAAFGWRW